MPISPRRLRSLRQFLNDREQFEKHLQEIVEEETGILQEEISDLKTELDNLKEQQELSSQGYSQNLAEQKEYLTIFPKNYKKEALKSWLEAEIQRQENLPHWETILAKFEEEFTEAEILAILYDDEEYFSYKRIILNWIWECPWKEDLLNLLEKGLNFQNVYFDNLGYESEKIISQILPTIKGERETTEEILIVTQRFITFFAFNFGDNGFKIANLLTVWLLTQQKEQQIKNLERAHEEFIDTQLNFYQQTKPQLWAEFANSNPPNQTIGDLLNFLESKLQQQTQLFKTHLSNWITLITNKSLRLY